MSNLYPVNDRIRTAAADLCDAKRGFAISKGLREGRNDDGLSVQAFAKFEAELIHKYKTALEEISAGNFNCSVHQFFMAAQGRANEALGLEK